MLNAGSASTVADIPPIAEDANAIGVVNPAEETIIDHVPVSHLFQLERIIQSAKEIFPEWKSQLESRRIALAECAAAIASRKRELAELITLEQGKPINESLQEVEYAAKQFQFYSKFELPDRILGDDSKTLTRLRLQPHGIAGLITPWNFPIGTASVKIAPALLAGNVVVLKPSAYTPLSSILLNETIRHRLPKGVFNIVIGGDGLGEAIAQHPEIAKLSLTGSIRTGRRAMCSAADNLKRLTLELGGNDPAIVLEDANPELIAKPIIDAAFRNAGQVCSAIKRLYAPRSLRDSILDALLDAISTLKLGNGLDPRSNLGPLAHAKTYKRFKRIVSESISKGAKILSGGNLNRRQGYFFPPTLIYDVDNGCSIVDQEQFGPALPVIFYDKLETAIAKANDSAFGLSASVWTSDPDTAEATALQLEHGRIGINGHKRSDTTAPFGGFKQSGLGRELGEWGLQGMGELQVINRFRRL